MFTLKRIIRPNKNLKIFISTTSVNKCDKELENEVKPQTNKEQKVKTKISNSKPVIKKESKPRKVPSDFFKPALKTSAVKVSKELGGDEKMCRELLDYIKEFEAEASEEISSHEFSTKRRKEGRYQDIEFYQTSSRTSLNIFNENIMNETENQVKLKIWDHLEAEELEYLTKASPQNYFQELIEWTNKGRLWHFPIDNDQGMEEEARTSFTEHIFLEQHLEPWCPKKGPLRNFMSLVLIGLSKNPYLSVKKKKEHIDWFRDYFEEKKKLLQELGAMGPPKEIESQQSKKS